MAGERIILVPEFTFTFSILTFVGEALLIFWLLWRAARGFVPEPSERGRNEVGEPLPA